MVSILTDNHVKTIENDITKVGKFSAVMRFFNANTSLFIEETSFKCPHLNCDERLRQGNHSWNETKHLTKPFIKVSSRRVKWNPTTTLENNSFRNWVTIKWPRTM